MPEDKTKNASTKLDLTLLPWGSFPHAARVMQDGAVRYGEHGYYSVPNRRSVYVKATLRHLMLYLLGKTRGECEPLDADSGRPHIHHALASLMIACDDSHEISSITIPPTTDRSLSDDD